MAAVVNQAFTDLYTQLKDKFLAEAPQMTYNPQSESSLRAKLAAALKPAYDQQIAARQRQTQAARAGIDADAAARGIGASTWVTDAKNRLGNAEATDIANLNSNYISTLASQLLNRIAGQESNRLSIEEYNTNQRKSAQDRALELALSKYGEWGAPVVSTGSGSSSDGPSGPRSLSDPALPELQSTYTQSAAKEIANLINSGAVTDKQAMQLKAQAAKMPTAAAMQLRSKRRISGNVG